MSRIKQIAVSVCAEGESIVALTDDGRIFRMCNDGPWRELPTLPAKALPKVIQMTADSLEAYDGSHGPVDIFRILTDTGEVWESCTGRNYGDGSWQRLNLPWDTPEVPFSECKNPDCPIGCPDSHCLDFPKEVHRG